MTANYIRQVRERQGLSQVELAAKSDLQPSLLNRVERYGFNVSPATAARIAAGLGVEVRAIFPSSTTLRR